MESVPSSVQQAVQQRVVLMKVQREISRNNASCGMKQANEPKLRHMVISVLTCVKDHGIKQI
jgi:hypothetical protein